MKLAVFAVTCGLCLCAGGCQEYLERRDTITLGVGDASETNKAIHTVTRWPAASRQDRWNSDGQRANAAIARYHAVKSTTQKGLTNKPEDNGADARSEDAKPQAAAPSIEK